MTKRFLRAHARTSLVRRIGACALAALAGTAAADEMTVLGGRLEVQPTHQRVLAWGLAYTEPLARHLDATIAYLNEGHPDAHHRDGLAAELWLTTQPMGRWKFAVGAGPYYYFDTTSEAVLGYANRHGFGMTYGAKATYHLTGRWSAELSARRVLVRDDFDSTLVFLGATYRWDALQKQPAGVIDGSGQRREISVMLGRTIVNSFASERSVAGTVEYRQGLGSNYEWSVAWLNEGDARLIRRNGVAAQAWVVRATPEDDFAIGLGAGPYVAVDRRHPRTLEHSDEVLAGLVSITARYRISPRWLARVTWNRVLADYHRDTDVFVAGLGYSF